MLFPSRGRSLFLDAEASECAAGVECGDGNSPTSAPDESEPPMTDQPQVKRRAFLAEPGTQPLLTTDPIEHLEGFERFVEATGIDPARVLATPVVAFPLPVPFKDEVGGTQRWEGIEPKMMWLPLFWLPPHLALRYQYRVIDEATGGTTDDIEIESDEVWAVRVMLELTRVGMYDAATGTWADILSFYGLDADDPVDQARVELWLNGYPDEVLDAIDLTEHIVFADNPEWGLEAARQMVDTLVPAQWSLTASGLLLAAGNYLAFKGEGDKERRDMLSVLGSVAVNALRTIPADETGIPVSELIESITVAAQSTENSSEQLVDDFMQALSEVSEDFEPYVAAYMQVAAEGDAIEVPSDSLADLR